MRARRRRSESERKQTREIYLLCFDSILLQFESAPRYFYFLSTARESDAARADSKFWFGSQVCSSASNCAPPQLRDNSTSAICARVCQQVVGAPGCELGVAPSAHLRPVNGRPDGQFISRMQSSPAGCAPSAAPATTTTTTTTITTTTTQSLIGPAHRPVGRCLWGTSAPVCVWDREQDEDELGQFLNDGKNACDMSH
jgi:hypothetical protein